MKKLVLLSVVLFTAATAFGQFTTMINRCNWMGGGNLWLTSSKEQNIPDNLFQFAWTSDVGYFVQDKWAVGLDLNLNTAKQGNIKYSSISAGPYTRYYFLDKKEHVNIFGNLNYNIGSMSQWTA